MKLHLLFTHFDQVSGDNLPTFSAREEHVLASAENVLKAIGDELGPAAERILRRRIDEARFFVAPIPTVSASPDQNRFLKDVASLVAEVAGQLDVILE